MAWFACATHRPISVNTGGPLSTNLGLILHHAVAEGSLYGRFNNPSAEVSAHFWVSKKGVIEQYVDTTYVAWHGRSLNINYIGVETEGCVSPPYDEPMTHDMIVALATLYKEGNQKHGWTNALCEAQGQRGFGYHRLPGSDNGPGGRYPTSCPCDERKNKRQDILNLAFNAPIPQPEPPHPTEEEMAGLTAITDKDGYLVCYGVAPNGDLWEITTKPADPNTPNTKTYRWSNITANGQNGQKLAV